MCSQNAVRSPMAEAMAKHFFGKSLYVQSAGVNKGEVDPFITVVMDEYGIDTAKHKPKTIDELEEWEGLNFDLVITLSPEAHHRALDLTRSLSMDVEYWPTPDPTITQGSRDQMLEAYRSVRDMLAKKLKTRLAP
jgi:protein-tyrosine-phosphatase